MTEAQTTNNDSLPIKSKREIDWAQYLDFTLFIKLGEIENEQLDKFRKDF